MNLINGMASLVQGGGSRRIALKMGFLHGVGGAIGGAGAALGLWLVLTPIRTLLPQVADLAIVLIVALVTTLADMGLVHIARQARQVPSSWYDTYGPYRSHGLYGLCLGAGLGTNVTYAVEYVVFLAPALLLPLPGALAGGLAFGFARTALVGPFGVLNPIGQRWHAIYAGGRGGFKVVGATLSIALAAGLVGLWLGLI